MTELLFFIAVLLVGFSLELLVVTYFCNRHLNGRPVLPRLTKFNIYLAECTEPVIAYANYRLENVRNGR